MPHEDGPSYWPVVATISLGSHAMFHYYQYDTEGSPSAPEDNARQAGRVINPRPVLSVLLEPGSVIVTTSSLYQSYLHGIQEIEEDQFCISQNGEPIVAGLEVSVANWNLLTSTQGQAIRSGGTLTRGTRYSLTCRDVAKVSSAKSFLRG